MPNSLQLFYTVLRVGEMERSNLLLFYLDNEIDFKKMRVQGSHITFDDLGAQTVFIRF